ncbi:MAG: hypothetical protein Q4A78_03135 [Peptostreptococcaceae bacterium]|nr:hypothetical protein [Peptostreptococcaceae bacterium]
MSLRELVFNIEFTGSAAPLLEADRAADSLRDNLTGIGHGADRSLGQAARQAGVLGQALSGAGVSAAAATSSMTALGTAAQGSQTQVYSLVREMRQAFAGSRIGRGITRLGSSIRQNIGNATAQATANARSRMNLLTRSVQDLAFRAFPPASMQSRLFIGALNDVGRIGQGAFTRIRTAILRARDANLQLSTQMQATSAKLSAISAGAGKIGSTLTTRLTLPIVGAGVASFKMASDLQENIGKTEQVFKDQSSAVLQWSKSSLKSFGMAQSTALDMASLYGDMGSGMGLSTQEATKMSMSLTGLAADLSSFKNVSLEQSQNALKGIFTGEGESLKNLGVVLTENNLAEYALSQGIQKKIKDMTQAEKVQLRYNYVMEMTKNAQGDFARTGGNAANQMRVFKEGIKQLSSSIGTTLIPMVTPLIVKANEWIGKLEKMDDKQRKTIVRIALFAAALGPAFKGISLLSGGLSIVAKGIGFFSKGMAAVQGLGAAGSFARIGTAISGLGASILPVIVTVGLLVAAGYLLYKNWDTVKAKGIEFVDSLRMKFSSFVPIVSGIWENLKTIFRALLPVFSGVLSGIGSMLGNFIHKTADLVGGILKIFHGVTEFLIGAFTGDWNRAWSGVGQIFSGIFDGIKAVFTGTINFITGGVNSLIRGFNKLGAKLPGGKAIQIPEIPMFARGVENFRGGMAIVGEQGPELVHLPKGSSVIPSPKTQEILRPAWENRQTLPSKAPEKIASSLDPKALGRAFPVSESRPAETLSRVGREFPKSEPAGKWEKESSPRSLQVPAPTIDLSKISKSAYDSEPAERSPRSYSPVFSPVVNIEMRGGEEPERVAEMTVHKIRELFDEWVDEADRVS